MPLRFQNRQWGSRVTGFLFRWFGHSTGSSGQWARIGNAEGDCLQNEIAPTLVLAIEVRFVQVRKRPCKICHSDEGDRERNYMLAKWRQREVRWTSCYSGKINWISKMMWLEACKTNEMSVWGPRCLWKEQKTGQSTVRSSLSLETDPISNWNYSI